MTTRSAEPQATTQTTTQTMWGTFRDCRKKAYWRYVAGLEPRELAWNLRFGRLIHACLDDWFATRSLVNVLRRIDEACNRRESDIDDRRTWQLATAMMVGYAERYEKEAFELVAHGATFSGDIVNPSTSRKSRSFRMHGRVDGVVKLGERHYLLEHRTATTIDADYIARLWSDFQVTLRANYIERELNIPIVGVVYDILVKAQLRQGIGETLEEFVERRDALIAQSKSGKSKAKQRQPETNAVFQQRLRTKYREPGMFHREILEFDEQRRAQLSVELWELTKALLETRRRGAWYENTSFCLHYQRPCEYLALCRSRGDEAVKAALYRDRAREPESNARAAS